MEVKPIVPTKYQTKEINGIPTQVVCSAFADHIFVVVTQYGKMGTLISLKPDTISGEITHPTVTTKVLLGKDEPLIHVYAKNMVTFISQESGNKPILLALALKDMNVEGLQAAKEVLRSCQVW